MIYNFIFLSIKKIYLAFKIFIHIPNTGSICQLQIRD